METQKKLTNFHKTAKIIKGREEVNPAVSVSKFLDLVLLRVCRKRCCQSQQSPLRVFHHFECTRVYVKCCAGTVSNNPHVETFTVLILLKEQGMQGNKISFPNPCRQRGEEGIKL